MKKLLSIVAAILFAATTFAKESELNEVTLTTIGTGASKEQAVNQALRSAIEQAFGAFVSANTSLVNDKITKDEIISISSGNIRSYKELGVVQTNNGRTWNVSLQAVVSLKKLTTFAKSHGSSCEFAGNTFAQNMKLRELNRINEQKVIENLFIQLDVLSEHMFDVKLNITGEPHESRNNSYAIPISVSFMSTEISENFYEVFYETLKSIELSDSERQSYDKTNSKYYSFELVSFLGPSGWHGTGSARYMVEGRETENTYSTFYLRSPFPCNRLVDILNTQVRNMSIYSTYQNIKQNVKFQGQYYSSSYYDERTYSVIPGESEINFRAPHVAALFQNKENIIKIANWRKFKLLGKDKGKKQKAKNRKPQIVVSFVGEIIVAKGDINNINGFEVRI